MVKTTEIQVKPKINKKTKILPCQTSLIHKRETTISQYKAATSRPKRRKIHSILVLLIILINLTIKAICPTINNKRPRQLPRLLLEILNRKRTLQIMLRNLSNMPHWTEMKRIMIRKRTMRERKLEASLSVKQKAKGLSEKSNRGHTL